MEVLHCLPFGEARPFGRQTSVQAQIMKYTTRTGNPANMRTDCLVVSRARAREIAGALDVGEFVDHALAQKPKGIAVIPIPTNVKNLMVVPGDDPEIEDAAFRRLAGRAARALKNLAARNAVWCLNDLDVAGRDIYWKTRVALGALSDALYWYDDFQSRPSKDTRISRVGVLAEAGTRTGTALAVKHGQALDDGMALARDLANTPPNVCNPSYLADEIVKLADGDTVTVEVLEEERIEELGMGAFMSVTRGSRTPGKLIVAQYRGGAPDDAPIVLIGKGVTFDTGGISIKPSGSMDEMKFDMCGAATVTAALVATAAAELPINLVSIAAAAENMPDGQASRPGDIVTTMSGQTVEILNTDAEGRLLLCDALTYAERFKPKSVVDVATLTGAMVVALGSHASGLFSNDDSLSDALVAAGQTSGDRAWPMPVWREYQSQLRSNFADFANVGSRAAGAVTAACFLSRFARKFSWAHLDVAGTAWRTGAAKGATARPAPLLFQYLLDQSAA